ncbi:MAG: hypothetical protein KBF78_11275 [Fuscovulum sp.]|nr:hypothetical protein [Fuscovulum sp.]
MAPAAPAPVAPDAAAEKGHVSVVYFHGMGSQRRFEETSRLIDRFDTLVESDFRRSGQPGKLRRIAARAERASDPAAPDVTYIRAIHLADPGNPEGRTDDSRYYEAYWADEMAEMRSTWGVIKWILRQVWRPVAMIRTPWRERQRLRRAFLAEMLEDKALWPKDTLETDFRALLDLYREFDHPDWLRASAAGPDRARAGSFDAFLAMIAERNHGKPDRVERLTALARAWHRRYVRQEAITFAGLLSLLLAILLAIGAVAVVVLFVLARIPGALGALGLADDVPVPAWATASWPNAATLAFGVILALGLRGFLITRMADVEAWSTYDETDEKFRKRQAVLRKSVGLLAHVLEQPGCRRVVVVAHSLGTSVAYDTLLAAVHANRTVNPQDPMTGKLDMTRISHFVTLASPVDKISYFFESFRSPVRRYRKVYDELRGDIGSAPFTRSGGQPQIHWVNVWDEADLISGPLQSPSAEKWMNARVDNMHVNSLSYLNPGTAHGAYFDNRAVIRMLFDIVYADKGNYRAENLPFRLDDKGQKNGLDYRAADFGPGSGRGTWTWALRAAVVVPWLWLAYVAVTLAGAGGARPVLLGLAVLATVVPLAAILPRLIRPRLTDPLD